MKRFLEPGGSGVSTLGMLPDLNGTWILDHQFMGAWVTGECVMSVPTHCTRSNSCQDCVNVSTLLRVNGSCSLSNDVGC